MYDSGSRASVFSRLALTLAGSHPSACPYLWHARAQISGAAPASLALRPNLWCSISGPNFRPARPSDKSGCTLPSQMEHHMHDQQELDQTSKSCYSSRSSRPTLRPKCLWFMNQPDQAPSVDELEGFTLSELRNVSFKRRYRISDLHTSIVPHGAIVAHDSSSTFGSIQAGLRGSKRERLGRSWEVLHPGASQTYCINLLLTSRSFSGCPEPVLHCACALRQAV